MQDQLQQLYDLSTKNHLEEVFKGIQPIRESLDSLSQLEIDNLKARFHQVHSQNRQGILSKEQDFQEINKIRSNLMSFIRELMDEHQHSEGNAQAAIEALNKEFIHLKGLASRPFRLREKNRLIKKISQHFIQYPKLCQTFSNSTDQGILAGLAYKIRLSPTVEELGILQTIAPQIQSHFTKGVFTNALAELIYSGMLRIGDDVVIRKLLELMRQDADLPLSKNIERVLAALDYLTDQDSA